MSEEEKKASGIARLEEKLRQLENDNMVLVRSMKEAQEREDASRKQYEHHRKESTEKVRFSFHWVFII